MALNTPNCRERPCLDRRGTLQFPSFLVEFQLLLAEAYVAGRRRAEARSVLETLLSSHRDDQRITRALDALRP
jgi:thioredoxin-like negative regulator of GroEL